MSVKIRKKGNANLSWLSYFMPKTQFRSNRASNCTPYLHPFSMRNLYFIYIFIFSSHYNVLSILPHFYILPHHNCLGRKGLAARCSFSLVHKRTHNWVVFLLLKNCLAELLKTLVQTEYEQKKQMNRKIHSVIIKQGRYYLPQSWVLFLFTYLSLTVFA